MVSGSLRPSLRSSRASCLRATSERGLTCLTVKLRLPMFGIGFLSKERLPSSMSITAPASSTVMLTTGMERDWSSMSIWAASPHTDLHIDPNACCTPRVGLVMPWRTCSSRNWRPLVESTRPFSLRRSRIGLISLIISRPIWATRPGKSPVVGGGTWKGRCPSCPGSGLQFITRRPLPASRSIARSLKCPLGITRAPILSRSLAFENRVFMSFSTSLARGKSSSKMPMPWKDEHGMQLAHPIGQYLSCPVMSRSSPIQSPLART